MLSKHERKGKRRRELGGELQMLDQQSIGCHRRHCGRWIRRDNDVTNGALALASLVELGPIGSASDHQEQAESLH
jgi:hypothetical protein